MRKSTCFLIIALASYSVQGDDPYDGDEDNNDEESLPIIRTETSDHIFIRFAGLSTHEHADPLKAEKSFLLDRIKDLKPRRRWPSLVSLWGEVLERRKHSLTQGFGSFEKFNEFVQPLKNVRNIPPEILARIMGSARLDSLLGQSYGPENLPLLREVLKMRRNSGHLRRRIGPLSQTEYQLFLELKASSL